MYTLVTTWILVCPGVSWNAGEPGHSCPSTQMWSFSFRWEAAIWAKSPSNTTGILSKRKKMVKMHELTLQGAYTAGKKYSRMNYEAKR